MKFKHLKLHNNLWGGGKKRNLKSAKFRAQKLTKFTAASCILICVSLHASDMCSSLAANIGIINAAVVQTMQLHLHV